MATLQDMELEIYRYLLQWDQTLKVQITMWMAKLTFGSTNVIPMSISLFTNRLRLGTVTSAQKKYREGKKGFSQNSKDFWEYNMGKFTYVDSIKPRGLKDMFVILGLENHLKLIKSRITIDRVAIVFLRAFHALLPRLTPKEIQTFVNQPVPEEFVVWPFKVDCRRIVHEEEFPQKKHESILSKVAPFNSEFTQTKEIMKVLKEDDLIVWSPNNNKKAEMRAVELRKFEKQLESDPEAAKIQVKFTESKDIDTDKMALAKAKLDPSTKPKINMTKWENVKEKIGQNGEIICFNCRVVGHRDIECTQPYTEEWIAKRKRQHYQKHGQYPKDDQFVNPLAKNCNKYKNDPNATYVFNSLNRNFLNGSSSLLPRPDNKTPVKKFRLN